ncbi:MAG: N-acetyl-gamma-glutamyl-phosphate reductase, partial [Muribaculaceae bacterium]|nr:N-acetyl-gamma-glutamyl-phosphate reductase [Muribaculaceae bacterium]
TEEEAVKLYRDYYKDAPFTVVSDAPIDLKQAVNTNKAIIHVEKHGKKLMITCAEDNLLKGASGQAVQNMNIMLGIDQRTGLRLKPSAF